MNSLPIPTTEPMKAKTAYLPPTEQERMKKEIDNDFAFLSKLQNQITVLTEDQFDKFMCLYQEETLKKMEFDPQYTRQVEELCMELTDLVSRYKPFVVIFKEPDGTDRPVRFAPLYTMHNQISAENNIVVDAFMNFRLKDHMLHRDRANKDLALAVSESQDENMIDTQRIFFNSIIQETGKIIEDGKKLIAGDTKLSVAETTTTSQTASNCDSLVDWD